MNEYNKQKIKYLDKIRSPKDFKNIPDEEMGEVAEEIRAELVRIVSKNGGHLSSNLGAVELSMAIHRVFDSPKDHIIFDVGHQSYVHKLLTGRYSKMDTLRESGGLCGFTNRFESEHDCFGAGHSSTSFSAALGFAASDKLAGSDAYTVAVIGDGAYTGGMIHEALNNCRKDLNLIIILNENEMSISKNIGRFASNLSKLRTRSGYFKTKRATGAFLKKIPLIGKWLFKVVLAIKRGIKNTLYGSNYFESMGLTYLGPIDGNDFEAVSRLLAEAKKLGESVLVHVKTVKGKGYSPAENAPDVYHGMSPDVMQSAKCQSFSQSMGHIITELAREDEKICAITAAMCDGTGLCEFRDNYKERFFDVGIAEEHALTFAAGLAANGMKPVVAIYSTFLQRGYDNIIHDIALQKLPVIICVDRAGLNARDGATHHGIFDVAFLSQIPNLKIYTPITYKGLELSIKQALAEGVPTAIRYPNGYENEKVISQFYGYTEPTNLGARRNFDENAKKDVVIVTHGRMVSVALSACEMLNSEGIEAGVILLEVLKPYDVAAQNVYDLLGSKDCGIILLEEEIKSGGFGMNLRDKLVSLDGINEKRIEIIATDDTFVAERQKDDHILKSAKVDAEHVCMVAMKLADK
ncbi:MAG: 1-deoxy-D-xylulose-5-phosphate synthase [Ruminococcaceae bacterium]|nr:1-deoxy-D-xylulose-5-phosphate synthase [Oscillospiraceae bacterium]